jgi:hypothetical protein
MNDDQDNITAESEAHDMVNHPPHYMDGPSLGKLECLDITRWLPFTLGNAFKYTWRAGKKNPERFVEDLEKALFYLREWNDLAPWRTTLYHGRAPAEAFFFKTDFRQWESWRYRALRSILCGNADEAIRELLVQIKCASAADEVFRHYAPEDETDDAD